MQKSLGEKILPELVLVFAHTHGEEILMRALVENYTIDQAVGHYVNSLGWSRRGQLSQEFLAGVAKAVNDAALRMAESEKKTATASTPPK